MTDVGVQILLMVVCGFIAGFAAAKFAQWHLERRTYSLECDVLDLKNKLLKEVKTRASHSRHADSEFEAKLEAAARAQAPNSNQPWWTQYVGKNNSAGDS